MAHTNVHSKRQKRLARMRPRRDKASARLNLESDNGEKRKQHSEAEKPASVSWCGYSGADGGSFTTLPFLSVSISLPPSLYPLHIVCFFSFLRQLIAGLHELQAKNGLRIENNTISHGIGERKITVAVTAAMAISMEKKAFGFLVWQLFVLVYFAFSAFN